MHDPEWYESWTRKAEELSWIGGGVRALQNAVEGLKDVPGHIMDCGSFRGGTAIAMAAAAALCSPEKIVFAFDTFAGMPATDPDWDEHVAGDFRVSLGEVLNDTKGLGNLILVPGEYKDTVPSFAKVPISLLFMDCDLYSSHQICYDKFIPLMSQNGIVIVEDYGTTGCKGCKKATDEYFGISKMHREFDFCAIRMPHAGVRDYSLA